jgi:uncharacterized protein YcfJ
MYAKDFLKKTQETKKKDVNTVLTETTKGTMVGAAIGGGVGLMIGFGRNKNLLMSAFIGAVIGGAISKIFIK